MNAAPPTGHVVLPWLTYVPAFAEGDDTLAVLRSARRVADQRHGFTKLAVHRRFRSAKNERIGKGNHAIERSDAAFADFVCTPDAVAIAHVPIRSAPQFIAKFASGWLGALASGTVVGEESFHWREAYAHLRSGNPVTRAQLKAFAANYGVPQDRWLASEHITLVDDPFLAPIELKHTLPRSQDPLPLVLTVAERLLAQRTADLEAGAG